MQYLYAIMLIGYARVSTGEQTTAAQVAALKTSGCELIFRDNASGGRWDQRRPQFGERPERLADRGRLVPELPFAGTRGFAIRSADDPVVGLHHRVGEKQLPLDGADRENREAAAVRGARGARRRSSVPPAGAAA